ncbi:protein takeout-like [Pectinophora gossypiella]|uniref:protein takeout-like n=1 Tax=Pectinophora gossypiella TaxID=13191 RepID=UPI00214ECF91|nr:protein takeout-like [Pectinophora gossypiella]
MFSNYPLTVLLVLLVCMSSAYLKQIPSYITLCKRDQSTIDKCAREAVEALRPKLIAGIPELNVPSIEPFYIPEIKTTEGELANLRASAKDVKVSGGGDFTIKSLNVDLDTFTIRARVRFPKLHLEGLYKLNTRILVVPLKGQGNMVADAVKCDAELVLYSEVEQRDGKEYIRFKKLDTDINIKDYRIRLDGLFNGDKALGDATNEAINQNRGEFLKATKPHLERTVSRILLDAANKIVDGVALDDLLLKP